MNGFPGKTFPREPVLHFVGGSFGGRTLVVRGLAIDVQLWCSTFTLAVYARAWSAEVYVFRQRCSPIAKVREGFVEAKDGSGDVLARRFGVRVWRLAFRFGVWRLGLAFGVEVWCFTFTLAVYARAWSANLYVFRQGCSWIAKPRDRGSPRLFVDRQTSESSLGWCRLWRLAYGFGVLRSLGGLRARVERQLVRISPTLFVDRQTSVRLSGSPPAKPHRPAQRCSPIAKPRRPAKRIADLDRPPTRGFVCRFRTTRRRPVRRPR